MKKKAPRPEQASGGTGVRPPPPIPAPGAGDAYERLKDRSRERNKEISQSGRDIAPLPAIANLDRRLSCEKSLRRFCEVYNPLPFYFDWSADQLKAIARLEEAVTLGALYAFAMPRGSGKSLLCRMAALWAVSYRLCRYAFIIGANIDKAADNLDAIKCYILLPDYAADFPEIAYPFRRLGNVANRAAGQLCDGSPTMLEWSAGRIVLPTVQPPENWPSGWPLRGDGMVPTSGSVLSASGLTGEGIRGSQFTLTTGESLRPDFVLLDDPQTPESARNPAQNDRREQLIAADVLGMAGPGRTISAVMPCTVIVSGDMVDRLLDRTKHPLWRGERTKMLRSMPSDLAAWDPYFELYARCALKEPPDFTEANDYYIAHQAEMDAGAESSWLSRKLPSEVSAIQSAMHLYFRNPQVFFAEYQNDPQAASDDEVMLTADQIMAKVSGHDRGAIPTEMTKLTAFIDVQKTLLYFAVVAWDDHFGGTVIDYGTWPDQKREYFTLRDAKFLLPLATKVAGEEGQLTAGLAALTGQILGREWKRDDGAAMNVDRCLIDAGYQTELIKKFCRSSPHRGVLMPSKGMAIGAAEVPLSERKTKETERKGVNWFLTLTPGSAVRLMLIDVNFWKSFVHNRLATAIGNRGSLTLYGDAPRPGKSSPHRMFADHLCAEYKVRTEGRGRVVDVWKRRPERLDNHLFDCLVGSAVAASYLGVRLPDMPASGAPSTPRRMMTAAEMREAAQRRARNAV